MRNVNTASRLSRRWTGTGGRHLLSRAPVMAFVTAMLVPVTASAQAAAPAPARSHWGLTASFTPTWEIPTLLADIITKGDEVVDIGGTGFSFGLVHGSARGGDWGLSFVRRAVRQGSTSIEDSQTCYYPAGTPCLPARTTEKYDHANFPGVELQWFIPFATIRQSVQLGINLGAGVLRPSGTVTRVIDDVRFGPGTPPTAVPIHREETARMSDDWGPVLPTARLEAMGALVVSRTFKVKAAWGLDFPGSGFTVSGVYLLGGN